MGAGVALQNKCFLKLSINKNFKNGLKFAENAENWHKIVIISKNFPFLAMEISL